MTVSLRRIPLLEKRDCSAVTIERISISGCARIRTWRVGASAKSENEFGCCFRSKMATTRRTRSSAKLNAEYAAAPAVAASKQPAKAQVDEDAIHHEYEFGGPVGVTAMMVCFPALFYYLYVCLFFYDGQSPLHPDIPALILLFSRSIRDARQSARSVGPRRLGRVPHDDRYPRPRRAFHAERMSSDSP